MNTAAVVSLIAFWLALGLALEAVLAARQWRHLAGLGDHGVMAEDERRRIEYGQRRALFQWLGSAERVARIALWLPAGLLLALAGALPVGGGFGGVLLVMLFAAADQLLQQPLHWGRWLAVERAFGMSRMSAGDMLRDAIVSTALRIGLAGGLAAWALWPFAIWSAAIAWPMGAFLGLIAVLAFFWARPNLIAPMFNRFSALPAGPLRSRLEAMMQRCDARLADVRVMDGSRRSRLANAYFTGLGRSKRIVLFDTLIDRLAPAELEAVLAHELGHFKCGHLRRYYGLVASLGLIALLIVPVVQHQVFAFVTAPAVTAIAAYLLLPALGWPLQPVLARLRRRYEYEADAYAARRAEPAALHAALEKLLATNLSAPTMDSWYAAFHASHPSGSARLARISAYN